MLRIASIDLSLLEFTLGQVNNRSTKRNLALCSYGHRQQAHFGAKSDFAGWPLDSRGVKKAETTVTRSPDLKRPQ